MAEKQLQIGQVVERLGITRRQVDNLIAKGLPRHGSGRQSFYLWSEVFRWFVGYKQDEATNNAADGEKDGTLTDAQTRKCLADAKRAELKLAHERGEVVAIKDVRLALEQAFGNVRSRLLSMPGKLAPSLAPITSKPKIKAKLEVEIREALEELQVSAGNIELSESEDDGNLPDND